ncbi:MAG: endonuclease domain-containing protein [Caulobacterales bacterium]|nr:endonuclease domain-containing protein [Caulobacterales bacterium]
MDQRLNKLAKRMRREPTVMERKLWTILRDRRLEGLKFRRQVVVGPYVVDFLCLRHRLIIEADGPFHDAERDSVRDAWLTSQGFQTLRFQNAQIDHRDWEVVGTIVDAVKPTP